MKPMTHAGEVVGTGRIQVVKLRETPRTWTDGRLTWPKFDRKTGSRVRNPQAYGVQPPEFFTLMTDTIRRLTAAELREPMQARLESLKVERARAAAEVRIAQRRLDRAELDVQMAQDRLDEFDRNNGGRKP